MTDYQAETGGETGSIAQLSTKSSQCWSKTTDVNRARAGMKLAALCKQVRPVVSTSFLRAVHCFNK